MKARIRWDAGFGAVETIIDVETIGEALKEAEAMARDQFDSNATWHAEVVEEVERGECKEHARREMAGGMEKQE
jgi:hypothetical protein